ncbi:MAG: DUF4342 domain-containing protein [Microcoleus sp. PH2017_01_SCD_O_A]|jgi:hypothetical protein|uniref:DUF4342 domain-containing protein n=1 Tax=Microcoleus sp. PH2017_01_SCD_O_A TaxID=2798812 RepID=UPI001D71AFFD|nr:DUF4342 domain-containing protein [Microcoleus sp. PH2017_01_SCD_O_A]MCC3417417.1 DUF4342 domain-containing protein [Microcoleus sp. PH2017_07_MST_O_A]MCC3429851.1 DUF4342 domain-containing protein [Microcoleus sp. PH2017_04_SCI_O_A]MCC3510150.1 DUF4342 domain-containing protein [Microcoleus sp. PH2017_17_BER_D_A]TAG65279.1 MAG: DUF4342 domain-containing protein [Oscillatoriales cyanobacterium]MCC3427019.1 DUF4342 domain-containing protein [Microcoleus sp. PH2017_01_SCD_O_A]
MNSQQLEQQVTILQDEAVAAGNSANPTVETPLFTSEFVTEEKVRVEEFKISADSLIGKVKELIEQGKLRRLVIKNSEGRILADIPLMAGLVGGVAGSVVFPIAAVLATVGAVVAHLTVVIERKE